MIKLNIEGDKMSDKYVNEIIEELKKSGSEIKDDELISKTASILVNKDYSLEEALESIAKEVYEETRKLLTSENKYGVNYLTGISSCIYLPDLSGNGEYKLKIIGGSSSRDIDLPVDENTVFDVASITKVFTLLLLFKLEQEKIIDLDTKIADINPDYKGLEDFTFNDLIRLHGIIYTDGRIDDASTKEEAMEKLKTSFLKSNSREENNYTDLGAIICGETIAKILSDKLGRNMSFEDVMNEYLIKPLGLKNTMFNPKSNNTAGNGNQLGLVHDPKARILGGAVGSAGIFTTSDDLALLAKSMYSLTYVNKSYIERMGEITFPNGKFPQKGNFGIYVKHPLGLDKTYTPSEFSTGSFSHQGWTGPVANFDPNNLIHQNILVNAVYKDDDSDKVKNDKPFGYGGVFDNYLAAVTQRTILMLVVKKFYDKYYKNTEDINVTERVM